MSNLNDLSHHINPRVRAYGKARLDIARRAQSRQDWDVLWKKPQHEFPFTWGDQWKQCIEYRVEDFAAEVGFFIDILGLPVNAFNEYFAMFTGPAHEFYFAITPTFEGQEPTPANALRLQFLVANIFQVAEELQSRGIHFEQPPQPVAEGSNYYVGCFRTPHGICIDLCGLEDQQADAADASQPVRSAGNQDEAAAEVEPLPQGTEQVYARLGSDPDDVFVEVLDQPTPSLTSNGSMRQPSSSGRNAPVPSAPAQPSPDAPEPTYEPLDDSSPTQSPGKPRTYRAISFTEYHS